MSVVAAVDRPTGTTESGFWPQQLGSPLFRWRHNLKYAYVAGSMYKGIGGCHRPILHDRSRCVGDRRLLTRKMIVDDLRIAFLVYELGLGGSTTFLLNLCTELRKRRIQHLVCGLDAKQVLKSDFDAAAINVWCPSITPRTFEDGLPAALAKLREFNPTHVLGCLGPQSLEVLRYVPPGVTRLGVVQTDDSPTYSSLVSYAHFLDATVGVSQHACSVLRRAPRLANKPVYYQPHGVPQPSIPRTISSEPNQPIRIIYVGRLIREQKRIHLFPRILERLAASGRPFIWNIVGDGPELNRLRQTMVSHSAGQRIVFTGKMPYHQVSELLSASDLFLLTSDYEGLPLSLLEALAAGAVPVVSDLESGIREVIQPGIGILVEPDDIDGYASAILRLESDRASLARMSIAAQELAQSRFSCSAMADRWVQMFSELPGKAGGWSPSPKIVRAIGMRFMGSRFLPIFRPVGDCIDFLRGWRF
jgi:glycosyltransferase involved in cell wall biosynthesis